MRSLSSIAFVLALAACTAERSPPAADAAIQATNSAAAPQPAPPAPASATPTMPTTPPAPPPDGADAQARFDGYGDVRFGTAAADMEKAWGGELKTLGKNENATCYFMTPIWVKTPAEFNFMIGDGKFVRFGTESVEFVAPGGGMVGMTAQALQALYHDALQSTPHKYVEGGRYLSLAASGVAPSKLVFEVDAAGKVTQWRVGVSPQVDYVEGCS